MKNCNNCNELKESAANLQPLWTDDNWAKGCK